MEWQTRELVDKTEYLLDPEGLNLRTIIRTLDALTWRQENIFQLFSSGLEKFDRGDDINRGPKGSKLSEWARPQPTALFAE